MANNLQNPFGGFASLYDPSIAMDQMALDRQTAIAAALRQQAMTPIETQGRQIGGVGYKVSPLEGIAKLLQGYVAGQTEKQTDQARQALAQKQSAALLHMLGDTPQQPQALPVGGGTPTPQGAPQLPLGVTSQQLDQGGFPQPGVSKPAQAAPSASGPQQMTLANLLRGQVIGMLGGEPMAKVYAEQFSTPEAIRVLRMKGQDPTAVGNLETSKLQREVVAPQTLGRAAYWSPQTGVHGLPAQIEGAVAVHDPNAPGGFQYVPVPGATEAIKGSRAAAAIGGTFGELGPPTVDATGKPLPVQSKAQLLGYAAPDTQVPPATQAARDDQRLKILAEELRKETDPKLQAEIRKEIGATQGGRAYLAPPLGTEAAQKGLDASWEPLKLANREATNTKSYLGNILSAAEKGAIVGPQADRREMVAGLLQLAGIKENVNTNATTQTQLLDKYANQIVTRLGQGGLGTDAARAMLESAYPGKHMNVDAIREAVGNLVGAQDMLQAKARFLQDPALKRDSTEYQKRELAFDQAADPKIFQALNIKDANARKAFLLEAKKLDPSIVDRITSLKGMGAL